MQRSFSPGAPILAILAGLALLAGCGSSKHATSTAESNSTAAPPATPTTSSSSSTQKTVTMPSTTTKSRHTTPSTTTKTTSHPTGGAGVASGSSGGSSGSGGGSTNARVPATFTISAGGMVSPPVISVPAFLAVQFTIVSHDARPHQVLLGTPTPHKLAVAAHGHASVLIPGLRAGSYALNIDGTKRGALSIGGEPGP